MTIFGGRSELVGPHCSGAGAMPTLKWMCWRKTGMPRGHESGDNPSWRRNMATPELDQDVRSNRRVAMPPGTLPRRLATPREVGTHTDRIASHRRSRYPIAIGLSMNANRETSSARVVDSG